MANDNIPDYMKGFDLAQDDWGFETTTTLTSPEPQQPSIDPKVIESSTADITHIKKDISSINVMINEIMDILNEENAAKNTDMGADVQQRFKDIEKIILPFLYNLSKSNEPYIHWPNRGPIIKAQIEKILKLTRG
jgi:hypothetical protein